MKNGIAFLAGLAIGHYGLRWMEHAIYLSAVVVAFEIGRHIH